MRGVKDILQTLASVLQRLSGRPLESLWPTIGVDGFTVATLMDVVELLYFRTLLFVLPLLTPLMKVWEVSLTQAELREWEAAHIQAPPPPGRTHTHRHSGC